MSAENTSQTEPAELTFDDTCIAFRHKSDREMLLAYVLFSLTRHPLLVKVLSQAAKLALDVGLPVKGLIKATVFRHFCGGENAAEYARVIDTLGKARIGTILDYSVEGSEDDRTFAATTRKLIEIVDKARTDPNIPCTCMKMTAIGAPDLLAAVTAGGPLNQERQAAWDTLGRRLDAICRAARDSAKPIYIDAEESWIQGAVDTLAERMMAAYNTRRAIVFTTLQLYRWDRIAYFRELIARARREGFRLGVKFVRGAYLEKERERAQRCGYPSPVNATKAETDDEFNTAIRIFVDNIDQVELCLGTHNEVSCKLLTEFMAAAGLPRNHPHVTFSQLYGMSDTISFNLARAGYNVSKYLPFGPVEATLPYLARRAEENTAIAGQMGKELKLIVKERERRRRAGGDTACDA